MSVNQINNYKQNLIFIIMKNNSIKFINIPFNKLSFIKNSRFINLYFILILTIFINFNSFSQSNQKMRIIEKSIFFNSLQSANPATNTLISLFKDVNSSVYLTNSQVNTYGVKPIAMFTDIPSLAIANRPNLLVNDIEIVTIKISTPSELLAPIDLSVVSKYKKVKYIYFRVNFNFELSQLMLHIKDCDPKVVLIYSIDKRS